MPVNNTIVYSTVVTTLEFAAVYVGFEDIYTFLTSSELDDDSISVNSESIILMCIIGDSIFIDQIGKWE